MPDEANAAESQEKGKDARRWYVLRCATGREDIVRETLQKRVKSLALEEKITDVLIPTEKVTEIRSGRKTVRDRKTYPGYIIVRMELGDDTWLAVRETPGIGDFLGSDKPSPMSDTEAEKILITQFAAEEEGRPKININFNKGDTVRVKEGAFENFEGIVEEIDTQKGRITVGLTIFGRATRTDLEYWQVEKV